MAERLRQLTQIILDPTRVASTLRAEVLEIGKLIAGATYDAHARTPVIAEGETSTPEGLALSPTMAAMCLDDYLRTIVFIRGLHSAITEVQNQIAGRPVNVLYVGCGPYATLAVPLMSILSADDTSFTLIDIHSESIHSATSIISANGFSDRVAGYLTCDASDYQIDPQAPPDIIVMEIMQAALQKEPQVALSRHLLRQAPNAILIPENIRVDLSLVNLRTEFNIDSDSDTSQAVARDRIPVTTVFSLNRNSIQSWSDDLVNELPAAQARIPDTANSSYQPMLLTLVQVFGHHMLEDYASGLTCPRTLTIEDSDSLQPGNTIQFRYILGHSPGLRANLVS